MPRAITDNKNRAVILFIKCCFPFIVLFLFKSTHSFRVKFSCLTNLLYQDIVGIIKKSEQQPVKWGQDTWDERSVQMNSEII